MRTFAIAFVAIAALLFVSVNLSGAYVSHVVSAEASQFLGKPVVVECEANLFGGGAAETPNRIIIDRSYCNPLAALTLNKDVARRRQGSGLITLTHEAIHLAGVFSEAKTECYAFQRVDEMAKVFGVRGYLLNAVLKRAYEDHRELISRNARYRDLTRCRPGGKWDLSPGDGRWP